LPLQEQYPPKLQNLLDLFDDLKDDDLRAEILIDYSKKFREVPPALAVRPFPHEHLVAFCESEAYLWVIPLPGDGWKFHFAVENPSGISARALAVILEETLTGASFKQIMSIPEDMVERVFRQNISMGKGLGLRSMVRTLQRMVVNAKGIT